MARILLADDDPMMIDLIQSYLELEGHAIDTSTSPSDVITMAKRDKPDIILVDLKFELGPIQGDEVVRLLKQEPLTQGIPVIVLTAGATPAERDMVFAAGADEYETKPVDWDRLLDKIQTLTTR